MSGNTADTPPLLPPRFSSPPVVRHKKSGTHRRIKPGTARSSSTLRLPRPSCRDRRKVFLSYKISFLRYRKVPHSALFCGIFLLYHNVHHVPAPKIPVVRTEWHWAAESDILHAFKGRFRIGKYAGRGRWTLFYRHIRTRYSVVSFSSFRSVVSLKPCLW